MALVFGVFTHHEAHLGFKSNVQPKEEKWGNPHPKALGPRAPPQSVSAEVCWLGPPGASPSLHLAFKAIEHPLLQLPHGGQPRTLRVLGGKHRAREKVP